MIARVQSTTPCNSFPKIFGGENGNTELNQMDVYNDYMALAGATEDDDLKGSTQSGK